MEFRTSETFTQSSRVPLTSEFSHSVLLTPFDTLTPIPDLTHTASNPFTASVVFTASDHLTDSQLCSLSNHFAVSPPFAVTSTSTTDGLNPNPIDQITKGLFSPGAIGAGIAGLVAVVALLLLVLAKKKRMNEAKDPESGLDTMEEKTTSNSEHDIYVSEYGLSDEIHAVNEEDNRGEARQNSRGHTDNESDVTNASEHNPEDLEDFDSDPAEK
jgi:hypothetical protein